MTVVNSSKNLLSSSAGKLPFGFTDDGQLLDDASLDPSMPGLNSPSRGSPNSHSERYSRKVFVGGLPPDIDEGESSCPLCQDVVLIWACARNVRHLGKPELSGDEAFSERRQVGWGRECGINATAWPSESSVNLFQRQQLTIMNSLALFGWTIELLHALMMSAFDCLPEESCLKFNCCLKTLNGLQMSYFEQRRLRKSPLCIWPLSRTEQKPRHSHGSALIILGSVLMNCFALSGRPCMPMHAPSMLSWGENSR